jgi:hypothetical protein
MIMFRRGTTTPPEPCVLCGTKTVRVLMRAMKMIFMCNPCFRGVQDIERSHLDQKDTL